MPQLTESAQVRSLGNLPSGDASDDLLPDSKLREHLGSAARKLRRWVGASVYADSLALITAARAGIGDGEVWPDDATLGDREEALREAEARLTLASLYSSLNMSTDGKGIRGGISLGDGSDIRLRNPAEIKMMIDEQVKAARDVAHDYITSTGVSIGVSYRVNEAGVLDREY